MGHGVEFSCSLNLSNITTHIQILALNSAWHEVLRKQVGAYPLHPQTHSVEVILSSPFHQQGN